MTIKNFMYAFTGFAGFQFLGYLSYFPALTVGISYLIGCVCTVALALGFFQWSARQSKATFKLSNAQILSAFSSSIILTVVILISAGLGLWIAN